MSEEKIVEAYYVNARLETQQIPLGGSGGGADITIEDAASDHKAADGYAVSPYALKQVETKAESALTKAEAGEESLTALSGRVDDLEDSVTPDLSGYARIDTDNIFTGNIQALAHPIIKGSTGTASDRTIRFIDNQGGAAYAPNAFGTVLNRVSSNGDVETGLYVHKNDTSRNISANISVMFPMEGDPYAIAPTPADNASSNEIITAEWANSNLVKLTGAQTITGQKTFSTQIIANGGVKGNVAGNAATATRLANNRNLQVNLARTNAQAFNGSANATSIGVSGILPTTNGGTGRNDGLAVSVTKKFTLSEKGALGYGENNDYLADKAALALWNGAYTDDRSNLTYCANGTIVGTSGNQTIAGNKTFSGTVTLNGTTTVNRTPTANTHVANKKYVDDHAFSGNYNDLANKPNLSSYVTQSWVNSQLDGLKSEALGAPDWSGKVLFYFTKDRSYTAPSNGYIWMSLVSREAGCPLRVNGIPLFYVYVDTSRFNIFMPVRDGDVVVCEKGVAASDASFIPAL